MIIGILTSGGDAPGMNAVVAGACEEVERLGGRALGIRGGFAGLASRRAEPITALQARRTTWTSPERGSVPAGGRSFASRRGAPHAARRSTRSASPGSW